MRKRRVYQRAKYLYSFANCLRFFRSANSRIDIANSNKFNVGTGDFCFSLWVHPVITSGGQTLFNLPGNPPGLNFALGINNVLFARYTYATSTFMDISGGQAPANTWSHIVYQRNGVATGKGNGVGDSYHLRHNGVLIKSGLSTVTIPNPSLDSNATRTLGGGFDGYMDDFIVFNRALTQAEIQSIYNSGNGAPPPEATWGNILAYWFFNERNGRVLNDYANTYNPALTTFQNGSLQNYTDAQVAANGQPQSGQTAWCDHFTLNPTTAI